MVLQNTFNCIDSKLTKIGRNYSFIQSQKSNKLSSVRISVEKNKDIIPASNTTNKITKGVQTILLNDLERLKNKATHKGWTYFDDNEVNIINEASLNQAKCFSILMDDYTLLPTVVPEEDGNICFQWDGENKVATVFFTEPDKFIYCIIDNKNGTEESGLKEFDATNINIFLKTLKRMDF